jgi:DNA-binding NtrC family response regulator
MDRDDPDELSTVLQPRLALSPLPRASFVLTVVEGPDRGRSITIDGSSPTRVLIGQSPVCEMRLEDRSVSRRHLALEIDGSRLKATDLGSTNGTLVNGVAVLAAYLDGTSSLRLGATVVRIDVGAPIEVAISTATSFGGLVGASREMRRLYPLCERLAQVAVPVIIEGETGTGKEVLAEALHEQGPRSAGPFIVFDCTAAPPGLMESEIFGHERGAFTGATSARVGVFEQAHGGTLLIDEIGDLDLALQAKLLRAIERSEVRRLGGTKWIRVDVRVLAATRRDLDREIQAGRFRDDLFHRLAVARIELPPLRARKADVSLLARRFARDFGGNEHALPHDVVARWEEQDWPGNVRQLRNAVARQLALGTLADSQKTPAPGEPSSAPSLAGAAPDFEWILAQGLPLVPARHRLVEEFERQYIERTLEQHGGNVGAAVAASGIARRYFNLLRARTRRP